MEEAPSSFLSGGLAQMRARIVSSLAWAACLFGFVAYVPSVIASFEGGQRWIAAVDTVLYIWIVAVRALPLKSETRAMHLTALLWVVGALLLAALGPFGYGPMWLVGATVAAGTLLGARAASFVLAAQAVALAAETAVLLAAPPAWWIDGDENEVFAWLAFAGASLFLSAALSFPIASLLRGLEATAEKRVRLEKELRQARTLEAIGTVAGSIAHEFSNLLQPILALASTGLASTKPGDPAAVELKEILSATEKARALVRQMLTVTRTRDAEARPASLAQAIGDLLVLLRAAVGPGVSVELQADGAVDDVVSVRGNDIQQVMLNLALNAAYAMKGKGGHIVARIDAWQGTPPSGAVDRGNGFVRLDVADDGAGMDASTLEHLFEPFFTTKPAGEGTGLGLATVHGIVRSLGGAISASSELGHGTTFSIAFPRAPAIA